MSIIHPHHTFPEDILPIEAAIWWRDNVDLFIRCLTQPKYLLPRFGSTTTGNLIIYPPKCNRMENEMNGRKPKRPSSGLSSVNAQPAPFKWINIFLSAEDQSVLERETADLEQLALAFIELGSDGLGLSVKFDSARKHYSVSIYGSDISNNMQPCGVSGAAPVLRDALLVSLYRFNTCLQGSFDGCTLEDATVQPKRFL